MSTLLRRQATVYILAAAMCLIYVTQTGGCAHGTKYRTTWRGYFDVYGNSAAVPFQFEGHLLRFAFAHKDIGIGSSGFKLYAKDMFGSDISFKDDHKFVGFFAPIYLYYIPIASHRNTGDVTPLVCYSYLGGCFWGLKQAKLFDLGIGFNYYFFDLRAGYNAISAESRNFFASSDWEEFDDYPVSWESFYLSVNLSPGLWLSLKSKLLPQETNID